MGSEQEPWKVLSKATGSQFWVHGGGDIGESTVLGQLASTRVQEVLETFGWIWKHIPHHEDLSETTVKVFRIELCWAHEAPTHPKHVYPKR